MGNLIVCMCVYRVRVCKVVKSWWYYIIRWSIELEFLVICGNVIILVYEY